MNQSLPVGSVLRGSAYSYTIEKVLGQGSFGITYLASTEIEGPLGRVPIHIAVKEFFAKELNQRRDDGSVQEVTADSIACKYGRTFRRESLNLSHMRHPAIVRVLEAFEANNTYYYAMEYLDGGSLDALITGRGGLPEAEALRCIEQIGAALSYMHGQKMLHLDLKPRNIMLRSDGSPVLIDFGLSKQYDAGGEPESSSTIGLGTPGYAPLEQANCSHDRSFAATIDVYALGATLYKMLTGHSPVDATTILNDGFPDGELRRAGTSERTVEAIRAAMAPQRKNRPQSVEEFLRLLRDAAQPAAAQPAAGASAAGVPAASAAAKPGTAPSTAPSAAAADDEETVKTLPAGAAGSGTPGTPSTPSDRKNTWLWSIVGAVVVVAALFGIGSLLNRGGEGSTPAPVDTLALVDSLPAPAADPSASAPAEPAAAPEYGMLRVESTPAGATIWLDGKNTKKTTPEILEEVAPGSHKVVLKLDGHADAAKSVTVKPDERTTCTLTLKETAQPTPAQTAQSQAQSQAQPASAPAQAQPASAPAQAQPASAPAQAQPAPAPAQTQPQAQTPAPAPAVSNKWTKTKSGNKTTYSNGEVSFTMVAVAGGTFTMGATREQKGDAHDDEKPAHSVTLSGFSIGETEVTQALWLAVMGSNPSHFTGNLQRPVERVSYNDCKTFISRLNSLTGENFRLPTEAEWEFAARGGNHSQGYKYSGSKSIGSVAWYTDNSNWVTRPVKTKSPNELGLYDMTGNVWEWCNDWYNSSYYSNSPTNNPRGPQSGFNRVYRGGGCASMTKYYRVSFRNYDPPTRKLDDRGLRLAQ